MSLSLWVAVSVIPASINGTLYPIGNTAQLIWKELARLIFSIALVVAMSYMHAMTKTKSALQAALLGCCIGVMAVPAAFIIEWRESAPTSAVVYTTFVFLAIVAWSVVVHEVTRRSDALLPVS
jgi:hypothetical protein